MSTSQYTLTSPTSPTQLQVPYDDGIIINLSSTSRIWVGDNPGVSSGFAAPVEALSFAPVSKGAKWAVLDSGATAPAQLLITDDISSYENPIALAAAVASKIAVQGVPNTLLVDQLANGFTVNSGATLNLDVHQYATLLLGINPTDVAAPLLITWRAVDGTILDNETLGPQDIYHGRVRLSVNGPSVQIETSGAASYFVSVYGSNRPIGTRVDVQQNVDLIDSWSVTATGGFLSGQQYAYTQTGGLTTNLQGRTLARFLFSRAACVGWIGLFDTAGNEMFIADTGEFKQTNYAAMTLLKEILLPPLFLGFAFHATAAGPTSTTSASVAMIQEVNRQ